MLLKLITFLLGSIFLAIVTAVVATVFFYVGWNHGVVPATTFTKEVSLAQAFCLSLVIATVCQNRQVNSTN